MDMAALRKLNHQANLAIEEDRPSALAKALARGADVERSARQEDTRLMRALKLGRSSCALALIQAGADPNAKALDGASVAYHAINTPAGCDFYHLPPTERTPTAIEEVEHSREVLRALARAGMRLNQKFFDSNLPSQCIQAERMDFLEILLSAGAPPNIKNSWGETPAFEAATQKNVEALVILARHGARLDAKNGDGQSLDQYAQGGPDSQAFCQQLSALIEAQELGKATKRPRSARSKPRL